MADPVDLWLEALQDQAFQDQEERADMDPDRPYNDRLYEE